MWFFIFLRTVPEECSPYNSQEDPVAKGSADCGVTIFYVIVNSFDGRIETFLYWNSDEPTEIGLIFKYKANLFL